MKNAIVTCRVSSVLLLLGAVIALSGWVAPASDGSSTTLVPLRFVQPLGCVPGDPGCSPNLGYLELRACVDRANVIYAAAGIKLWIKSVEYSQLPKFRQASASQYTWGQVKTGAGSEADLLDVFPTMPADAYNDTLDVKLMADWLSAATALYGDPDELLVWILGGPGQSNGQSPIVGRTAFIFGSNCYVGSPGQSDSWATTHLAHELGHCFGPRHPFDGYLPLNPITGSSFTLADEWDVLYCASPLHFFTSRDDFLANPCPEADLERTYSHLGSFGPFEYPFADILGQYYFVGDPVMYGLVRSTGGPHVPPARWGFAFDVMGYYSVIGLDTRAPAFFNDTQLAWIEIYLKHDVAYQNTVINGEPALFRDSKLTYDLKLPRGTSETYLTSLRTRLGTSPEDFIWWSNGDWSFARQLMPIKGTSYKTVAGDFDGDGRDDIIWYNASKGTASIWWSDGDRTFTGTSLAGLPTGCAIFAGDFDGDHRDDFYLYRSGVSGDRIFWSKGKRTFLAQAAEVTGAYKPFAADLDGDGADDIVWYHPYSGTANIWWSDGDRTFTGANGVSTGLVNYTPVVGNFDGQAGDDVFWYRSASGAGNQEFASWSVTGSRIFLKVAAQGVSGRYQPFSGDFNGDHVDDVFWDSAGDTTDYIWSGSPSWTFLSMSTSVYGTFLPVAGDFDGDGRTDIFWYRGPY